MKRLFVLLIMAVLLFHPTDAPATDKLTFATTEWPPMTIMKDGELIGIATDIIREVCKRMEIEPEFQVLPWQRAVNYVKTGEVDVLFAPKKTEERTGFLYFCTEPLYMERLVIIARKESRIKAKGLDELKDKVFGVVRGYSYGPVFDSYNDLKTDMCDTDRQLLIKLDGERMDVAVGEEGNLKFLSRELGGFESRFETVYILSEDPNYVAFSIKALGEKGKTLAEKFSQIQRHLKEEGIIQKIEDKYLKVPD